MAVLLRNTTTILNIKWYPASYSHIGITVNMNLPGRSIVIKMIKVSLTARKKGS